MKMTVFVRHLPAPLCAIAILLAVVPSASAIESTIYPGVGIGKVRLGMKLAGVEKALGHYEVVNERTTADGASYLEVGWEFGRWTVGIIGGKVVKVATTARAQRTPKRIGPGSTWRALVNAYPGGTCWFLPRAGRPSFKYVVSHKPGLETIYRLQEHQTRENWVPVAGKVTIYEVEVRSRPLPEDVSPIFGTPVRCRGGWEKRDVP